MSTPLQREEEWNARSGAIPLDDLPRPGVAISRDRWLELLKVEAENAKLREELARLARPFFSEEGATAEDENTRLRAENALLKAQL